MPYVFCPACGARHHQPEGLAGRDADCPRCGGMFRVPEAIAAPPPVRPPESAPRVVEYQPPAYEVVGPEDDEPDAVDLRRRRRQRGRSRTRAVMWLRGLGLALLLSTPAICFLAYKASQKLNTPADGSPPAARKAR